MDHDLEKEKSHTHTLPFSLQHTHTHTHCLSVSNTHTHTHTHTKFSLSSTHTHTHTHCLSLSNTHTHCLSLSSTHTQFSLHTHTHTHTTKPQHLRPLPGAFWQQKKRLIGTKNRSSSRALPSCRPQHKRAVLTSPPGEDTDNHGLPATSKTPNCLISQNRCRSERGQGPTPVVPVLQAGRGSLHLSAQKKMV